MIKGLIKKWETKKPNIKFEVQRLVETNIDFCDLEYVDLLKLALKEIESFVYDEFKEFEFNIEEENIITIDNGDYQGTKLFIIANDTYQPDETEYLSTYVDYGSCSGCDTLQSLEYDNKENKINGLMTLILHMIQRMKFIYSEDEEVE